MEISQPIAEPLDLGDSPLDDALVAEARADARAFAPLYERHIDHVYRYLRARGASDDDATELTALTFERALRHIDRYRTGGSGFGPWLLRIARNAFIDAGRRQHNRFLNLDEVAGLAAPGTSLEDTAIAADEQRQVLALVARLPEVQRDALALRFAGGLSSRQIAAVIGKSEAATKKLLTRSLATLKEATRNDAGDD